MGFYSFISYVAFTKPYKYLPHPLLTLIYINLLYTYSCVCVCVWIFNKGCHEPILIYDNIYKCLGSSSWWRRSCWRRRRRMTCAIVYVLARKETFVDTNSIIFDICFYFSLQLFYCNFGYYFLLLYNTILLPLLVYIETTHAHYIDYYIINHHHNNNNNHNHHPRQKENPHLKYKTIHIIWSLVVTMMMMKGNLISPE